MMIFKGMISAELFQELVESRSQSCFSRPSQGDEKTEQSQGALTRAGAGSGEVRAGPGVCKPRHREVMESGLCGCFSSME